ncbi:MAG: biotin-independent malonate decarboxylase subunit gamma [Vulcanimicrobiaceae bacterium]
METATLSRGYRWAHALSGEAPHRESSYPASLCVVDGEMDGATWRAIAIVPDPGERFPRARGGELGLDAALGLARAVREAPAGAAILAVVDVPGQAFGAREESAGIHLALAAAVDAYATERRAGRPIFALVVGKAISGAFLAHGLQAGWIGALDDPGVEVHVMSAASVARVTRASADEVARMVGIVPATARDIASFASFGAVDERFAVRDALAPSADELARIRVALANARRAGLGTREPLARLAADGANVTRAHARAVRARIAAWWDAT